MQPLVSLCIPTNGIIEWVFPVLDSIYNQDVEEDLYEVVVIDNGNNKDFKEEIKNYAKEKTNLVYKESFNTGFLNEIDTYKTATGLFIKFVNHRTKLTEGTLKKLIDFVRDNKDEKTIIYYSNGVLKKLQNGLNELETFDEYIKELTYYSSWSTGMAFWKSDFEKIPRDISNFNELFPHTTILFAERNKKKYIIDNSVIFDEIPADNTKKGKYDIFYAFTVEYPSLITDLLRIHDISLDTCRHVLKENKYFCSKLIWDFIVLKKPCSYDLSGLKKIKGIYYSLGQLILSTIMMPGLICLNKVRRML